MDSSNSSLPDRKKIKVNARIMITACFILLAYVMISTAARALGPDGQEMVWPFLGCAILAIILSGIMIMYFLEFIIFPLKSISENFCIYNRLTKQVEHIIRVEIIDWFWKINSLVKKPMILIELPARINGMPLLFAIKAGSICFYVEFYIPWKAGALDELYEDLIKYFGYNIVKPELPREAYRGLRDWGNGFENTTENANNFSKLLVSDLASYFQKTPIRIKRAVLIHRNGANGSFNHLNSLKKVECL